MMKLLVVFGATDNGGKSVINHVINDPVLAKEYRIRAVACSTPSSAVQALQQMGKVEVVQGDIEDPSSLQRVLDEAHTIYWLTTTIHDERLEERELSQGRIIANAAAAAGAEYLIFSTLFHITHVSNAKDDNGRHAECKAEVEHYIMKLSTKTEFLASGSFIKNFNKNRKPRLVDDSTYILANIIGPRAKLPLINIEETGRYVAAILANSEQFEGKVFAGTTQRYTMEEILQIISESSGKEVASNQRSESVFRNFIPPTIVEYLFDMLLYIQDFGYCGSRTEDLVAWSAANYLATFIG